MKHPDFLAVLKAILPVLRNLLRLLIMMCFWGSRTAAKKVDESRKK